MDIASRFEAAHFVREQFPDFGDFAALGMGFLGFSLTPMQADIAQYCQNGPRLRMIMAQRGEAKSTIAALYAVWRTIQDPTTNTLIISGGEKQASEVASLVVKLIMLWDILEYLRPDKAAGDRTSVTDFDVHWSLKGVNKSPSVACVGITANLQGKRAHLLIPDDIETTKNGLTVTQREHLKLLTREFTSINTHGDILYLGTPQTKDSIYNELPGRGFDVRIWPGRFPTNDECEKYGDRLAPFLADRIKADPNLQRGGGIDGSRGQPADPYRYDEDALVEKELDQGPEGFQLQFMLDTSLADAARQQLKLSDFIVADFDPDRLPTSIVWRANPQYQIEVDPSFPAGPLTKMYRGHVPEGTEWVKRPKSTMTLDPAGGGGDELAFSVTCAVSSYIHWLDCGGFLGGLTETNALKIADLVLEHEVEVIRVETNMGHGLFEKNLFGEFVKLYNNADKAIAAKYAPLKLVGIVGEYATGQKERRIIEQTVGALQRHRIVVHQRVFESDTKYNLQHSLDKRAQRSVFYQISNITTDRNSLVKDDRLDAAGGSFAVHKGALIHDEVAEAEKARAAASAQYMANPMGYDDPEYQRKMHKPSKGAAGRVARRRY